MIDYNLPYYGLLMEKTDCENYPHYTLQAGYTFQTYREGMKADWVRIHTAAQMVKTEDQASRAFDEKILPHGNLLKEFCVFICDKWGNSVANASLLPGFHFGEKRWQIYWVAVVPEHEGKHLCHALITHLLDIYNKRIGGKWIYLATQTWNYCAISVYKDLGFRPYLGPKPVNWRSEDFARSNTEGWRIVDTQIGQYITKRYLTAYEQCLEHAKHGELCFLEAMCELRYDVQGVATLVFLRRDKIDPKPGLWNISRLMTIYGENGLFQIVDADGLKAPLKQIIWLNVLSQTPISRRVSRQAFLVRMMGACGILLRGQIPIIRHGVYYGQLPYGDTESLAALRAEICRQIYDVLKPIEVTGPYDA